MTATYQIKKKAIGGYAVTYECPHCQSALTSSLNEAGTTQPCPTCGQPFIVPGKAEWDQLQAKAEGDRRAKEEAKRRQELERVRQKQIAEEQASKERDALAAQEQKVRAYQASHCPYCWEEIKPGVKKCKHCHEYLDAELLKGRTRNQQDIVRFRPPLEDVFWLVVKFWAASLLFALVGWLVVMLLLFLLTLARAAL